MSPRNFWLISGFYFFFFSIIGVYVIFLPKILELKGYTPFEIGLIFSMSPLMRFIVPFFFLRYPLTLSLYRVALFLTLVSIALFFVTIENLYLFLGSNILLGISFALTIPYVEAAALSHLGKENYGKSRLFGSIGFIVVALLLAKNLSVALELLFLTAFLTTLFGWYIYGEGVRKKIRGKFDFWRYWWLWANFLLVQISFGAFYNFFTIYESERGLDYETISYLWSVGVVAEILMLYFQTPLMRGNLLKLLEISTLITSFRWFLVYLFPSTLPILYFSQTLHAFSFALYYSAGISYLYEIYPNKTLAQQFFGGISFGLGGMLGSFLAGAFYGKYLFLYASVVAFLAYLLLLARKVD